MHVKYSACSLFCKRCWRTD